VKPHDDKVHIAKVLSCPNDDIKGMSFIDDNIVMKGEDDWGKHPQNQGMQMDDDGNEFYCSLKDLFDCSSKSTDALLSSKHELMHAANQCINYRDQRGWGATGDTGEAPPFPSLSKEQKFAIADRVVKAAKSFLEKCGFQSLANGFDTHEILFGFDDRGIFGACPTDPMHAFQSGIVMYITRMIVDKLGSGNQPKLDRLVERMVGRLRSSSKDQYPRFNFSKGFCKLSFITSDEWVGKLFVLLLVALTQEGRDIMAERFSKDDIPLPPGHKQEDVHVQTNNYENNADDLDGKALEHCPPTDDRHKDQENKEDLLRKCSYNDFIELTEALLCFHAFYKVSNAQVFDDGVMDVARIDASIRRMMSMVKLYMPRKIGHRWNIQKFHDMLHIADDMRRYGSPKNFDAGFLESSLRFWAKFFAFSSQKRGYNTFVKQVAERIHEYQSLLKARRANGISGSAEERIPQLGDPAEHHVEFQEPKLQGSRFRIYVTRDADGHIPTTKHFIEGKKSRYHGAPLPSVIEGAVRAMHGSPLGPTESKLDSVPYKQQTPAKAAVHADMDVEDDIIPPYHHSDDPALQFYELWTECQLSLADYSNARITIRCHPDYQKEGEWYDWAMIRFDDVENIPVPQGDEFSLTYHHSWVPCKCLGFLRNPLSGTVSVLLHACDWQTESESKMNSVITERWNMEYQLSSGSQANWSPRIRCIGIDSIARPCFCVQHVPGFCEMAKVNPTDPKEKPLAQRRAVTLVRPRDQWGYCFT
jgi:hypothetical protein